MITRALLIIFSFIVISCSGPVDQKDDVSANYAGNLEINGFDNAQIDTSLLMENKAFNQLFQTRNTPQNIEELFYSLNEISKLYSSISDEDRQFKLFALSRELEKNFYKSHDDVIEEIPVSRKLRTIDALASVAYNYILDKKEEMLKNLLKNPDSKKSFRTVLNKLGLAQYLFIEEAIKELSLKDAEFISRPAFITDRKIKNELTSRNIGEELQYDVFLFDSLLNRKRLYNFNAISTQDRNTTAGEYYVPAKVYSLGVAAFISAISKIMLISGDIANNTYKGLIRSSTGTPLTEAILKNYDWSGRPFYLPHSIEFVGDNIENFKIKSKESTLSDKIAILKGLIRFYVATDPKLYSYSFFGEDEKRIPAELRYLVLGLTNLVIQNLLNEHVKELHRKVISNGKEVALNKLVSLTSNVISEKKENTISLEDLIYAVSICDELESLFNNAGIPDELIPQEKISEIRGMLKDLKFSQGFFILGKFQDIKTGLFLSRYAIDKDERSTEYAPLWLQMKAAETLYELQQSEGGTFFSSGANLAVNASLKEMLSTLDCKTNSNCVNELSTLDATIISHTLFKIGSITDKKEVAESVSAILLKSL